VGITWLASFPKSGNTWVRFLLYAYLFGDISTSGDINRRIPAIHRDPKVTPGGDKTLFVKTHFVLSDKHPQLGLTDRAVYILRHPKDILLSGLNYHRMTGAFPDKATDEHYAKVFISRGSDPLWLGQGFGTWDEHATSWTTTERFPVHVTTYEKLKTDTGGELAKILAFVGQEPDDERVAAAVRASEFDKLRALEVREKTKGEKDKLFPGAVKRSKAPRFFMNKGKSGQSLEKIAPGLDAIFDKRFADAMTRHGYG
jgi:Sulfotransferase domain